MSRRAQAAVETGRKLWWGIARHHPHTGGRPRGRGGSRALVAVGVAVAAFVTAVAIAPEASAVSSSGPGVQGTYGHIGASVAPGVGNVYCIDSSLDIPFGRGVVTDTVVSSLPARPGVSRAVDADRDAVRGMNFIVSTWGGTGDPVTAAAVGIATMSFLKTGGFDTAASYVGRDDVIRLARSMYDQARAVAAAAAGATAPSGTVVLTVDPSDNSLGSLRVDATVPASGTLTLTHGTFVESGTDTLAGVRTGVDYPIVGVPPAADGAPYRIGAASVGGFTGGQIWPDRIRVLDYGGGFQRMIVGVGQVPSSFPVRGEDQHERTTTFQPVLTSRTAMVSPDGTLSDTLAFATAPDENRVNNPWPRRDGGYHPVSFTVTAYAAGGSAPAETPDVPEDAQPVGAAAVLAAGPGTSQTVVIPGTHAQGRYTFVASYDEAGTPPETRALLPADYAWSHAYGMASETTTVPMRVTLSSKILSDSIGPGGRGDDTVSVDTDGRWLSDADGRPIEIIALGAYIHLPPSLGTPVPTDALPDGAEIRGIVKAVFTSAGTQQTTSLEVLSGEISAPEVGDGSMTWQWSVPAEAQSSPELVIPITERLGLPEQTQRIALPTVTTKAQTGVPWGGSATDTALVTGPLPGRGTVAVRWEAFRAPDGATDLTAVCTADNRLPLDGTPVMVTASPGEYASPAVGDVRFPVVWQEIVTWIPTSGAPVDFHRGECGIADEVSTPLPPVASPPPVSAQLAATGGSAPVAALCFAAGLGLTGVLALLLARARRRRRAGRTPVAR